MTVLERIAIVVASLAIAIGVIAIAVRRAPDRERRPRDHRADVAVGTQFRDLGDAALSPEAPSRRATTRSRRPAALTCRSPCSATRRRCHDNQLLQALALGDVVVLYGTRTPPPGLRALADSVAAPFSPALAAAGQAVILARRPALTGLIGLAWTRLVHVRSCDDPQLRSFILFWLGRGAARPVP